MSTIESFCTIYEARFQRNWAGVDRSDAADLMELHKLRRPGLPEQDVKDVLNHVGFGVLGMESYVSFLASFRCASIDTDGFLEFGTSLSTGAWANAVQQMRGSLSSTTYFAFGFDVSTSARFCLERRIDSDVPIVSIVDGPSVLSSAFSSFDALLLILTEILRANEPLYVARGAQPTARQRGLVQQLRKLDPAGFGTVGWPNWFERLVGGSGW